MRVGLMNHPAAPVERELRRIAGAGVDLVDLTLEPPGAWPVDGGRIGSLLREIGLGGVGHTAYYLPIASPFHELRKQARQLFGLALDAFAAAGIELVSVHPQPLPCVLPEGELRARNAEAIALLVQDAAERGITLMVENLGEAFASVEELRPLFEAAPEARFHLDVGHANLGLRRGEGARAGTLLDAFGERLAHVHVHDNMGGRDDLHLPLGAGTIDWQAVVRRLSSEFPDVAVTLEVFSPEREHVRTSLRLWREWWSRASEEGGRAAPGA